MRKIGDRCSMSELKIGQKAVVISYKTMNKKVKRHLLDMGITKGTIITVKKIAPLGDPIDIVLRGYELCICIHQLNKIEVEIIK